jgi:hypothetical protein
MFRKIDTFTEFLLKIKGGGLESEMCQNYQIIFATMSWYSERSHKSGMA